MRQVPQVEGHCLGCTVLGVMDGVIADQLGRNLPIVVKPDHLRHDMHSPREAYGLRNLMDMYYVGGSEHSDDVVKVVLTTPDGDKTARLPCTGFGFDGHELHVYAEVAG